MTFKSAINFTKKQCRSIEDKRNGPQRDQSRTYTPRNAIEITTEVLLTCKSKKETEKKAKIISVCDQTLSNASIHTDRYNLENYSHFLTMVPRLVNVVTVRPSSPPCMCAFLSLFMTDTSFGYS